MDEDYLKLASQLFRNEELRHETAIAVEEAIFTDLSVIKTLFVLAAGRSERQRGADSKRAEAAARRGIAQIRRLASGNKLLSAESKASISRQCDELERTEIPSER